MKISGINTSSVEFVSCNGTQDGSGTAANTSYTPTTPDRTASGSVIPAVTISSTTATTMTTYILSFSNDVLDSDIIVFEYKTANNGWTLLGQNPLDGIGHDIQGSVTIGVCVNKDSSSKGINVSFSNAGRICGSTYGQGSANWSAVTSLGWRWRVKKISF